MQKLTLGYWNVKGSAEFSRLLLAYLKIQYTNEHPKDFADWEGNGKPKMEAEGFHFPNLPYLKDGEFEVSESAAILAYIAEKYGTPDLLGNDLKERAQIFELQYFLKELVTKIYMPLFQKNYKEQLIETIKPGEKVHKLYGLLSKKLGENEFLVGNHFTIADIYAGFYNYMVINILNSAEVEGIFKDYPNLVEHKDRIFALDGIKEYVAGEEWKNRPMLMPVMFPWVKENQ